MKETLEIALEQKKTNFYKDLISLSKFDEKKVDSSSDEMNSLKLTSDLGFINSKAIVQRNEIISKNKSFNDAVKQAVLSLQFIKEMTEYFGKGTILVKRDDFVYLIQKYGLVCGRFSDYLGVVPDKNLLEIEEARKKIESLLPKRDRNSGVTYYNKIVGALLNDAYNYRVKIISSITYDDDSLEFNKSTKRYLESFPYVLVNGGNYNWKYEIKDYLSDYISRDELEKVGVNNFLFDYDGGVEDNGMFICAPRKNMKNAEKRITFRKRTTDPFICSLVPYGVVIYSRWGKEAEDEMFTKYDKLFTRMIGK